MKKTKPEILILSGISASGKTTLQRELAKVGYHKVITSTTRQPRIKEGEVDGKDYFFFSKDDFFKDKALGRYAETEQHGSNFYGTQWSALESNLTIPCAILEPKGAKKLKKILEDKGWIVNNIWVDCPFDIALQRVKSRDSENKDSLDKRISLMTTVEPEWAGHMNYDLTVNGLDNVEDSVKKIKDLHKKKCKNKKRPT